jgi:hypothetical protein
MEEENGHCHECGEIHHSPRGRDHPGRDLTGQSNISITRAAYSIEATSNNELNQFLCFRTSTLRLSGHGAKLDLAVPRLVQHVKTFTPSKTSVTDSHLNLNQ